MAPHLFSDPHELDGYDDLTLLHIHCGDLQHRLDVAIAWGHGKVSRWINTLFSARYRLLFLQQQAAHKDHHLDEPLTIARASAIFSLYYHESLSFRSVYLNDLYHFLRGGSEPGDIPFFPAYSFDTNEYEPEANTQITSFLIDTPVAPPPAPEPVDVSPTESAAS
jgi:hypothetical protein